MSRLLQCRMLQMSRSNAHSERSLKQTNKKHCTFCIITFTFLAIIHSLFSSFSDGARLKAGVGRKDRKLQVCELNATNSGRVSPLIAE